MMKAAWILAILHAATDASGSPPPASPKSADAEYAFKWRLGAGGPQTLQKTAKLLKQPSGKDAQDFEVVYFADVEVPPGFPAGVQIIVRERKTSDKVETTFKLRGGESARAAIDALPCGLTRHDLDDDKREFDVVFTGAAARSRNYSSSCGAHAPVEKVLATGFKARRPDCNSTMSRLKFGRNKIEEWRLHGGERYIEVSRNGLDTAGDARGFVKDVVEPLTKAGAVAAPESMTALAGRCP